MKISDKAVVLSAVKYADKKHIVRLYTRSHGVVTVSTAVGHSARSGVRPAAILPLTFIDAIYSTRGNREVQVLTEASVYFSPQFSGDLRKLAIAQFISEVMARAIREQGPNERLFDFIEHCLDLLQRMQAGFSDLHLYFMRELSKHNGFDPQNNRDATCRWFDCREGVFTPLSLPYPLGLTADESELFSGFLAAPFMSRRFTSAERQQLLDALSAYYSFHVPSFGELKSVQVLREVLAG